MRSIPTFLAICGSLFLAAVFALALTQAPLGSPLFFTLAAFMVAGYAGLLARVWNEPVAAPMPVSAAIRD